MKSRVRAKTIDELAAAKKPTPKTPRKPAASRQSRERDIRESKERREQGNWKDARPGHFVALYIACHEKIYGFAPTELESAKEYAIARMAAKRLLESEFEGRSEIFFEFMRWMWKREESYEKWRRENNRSGKRVGWRLQFHASTLNDYRADLLRKKGGR